jgi:tRNA pseudouridine-54 N-methylase
VPQGLVALAVSAGLAVVADETTHFQPGIFVPDESQGAVLSKMAREYVIMLILQDMYAV